MSEYRMSTRRKLAIASWDEPREGNIYGKLTVDATQALAYLDWLRQKTGEHVTITHDRGIRALVEGVEYLGGDSLLTCRIGGQTLAVRAPGSVRLARSDGTWLAWAPEAQHFFAADGVRHDPDARHHAAIKTA